MYTGMFKGNFCCNVSVLESLVSHEVFDAMRARKELDNFLNQFHYGGATKSVVVPRRLTGGE